MKTISPKDARRLHDHDPERSKKPWKPAILIKEVRGKYIVWKVGKRVLARHDSGSSYTLQSDPWKGSMVPLCNVIFGIPRGYFRIL